MVRATRPLRRNSFVASRDQEMYSDLDDTSDLDAIKAKIKAVRAEAIKSQKDSVDDAIDKYARLDEMLEL